MLYFRRSGRKATPGNITVVEAADDSQVKQSYRHPDEGKTLLIPTVHEGKTKERFFAPFKDVSSALQDEFTASTPKRESQFTTSTPRKEKSVTKEDIQKHIEKKR